MSTVRWTKVRERLRQKGGTPPMRPAEEFWSDFAARARYVPQTGGGAEAHTEKSLAWRRALAAGAAALLLGAVVVWTQMHSTGSSQVKRIEVLAPHTGVVILNPEDDRPGTATLVWVVDLEQG